MFLRGPEFYREGPDEADTFRRERAALPPTALGCSIKEPPPFTTEFQIRMTLRLENKTIAVTEHRFGPKFGDLIKRHGARVMACPLQEEEPVEDRRKLQEFIRAVIDGGVDILVFSTGVGVRFLLEEADTLGEKVRFLAAANRTRVVVRGSKPAVVLRKEGIQPDLVPPIPTSTGVLDALENTLRREVVVAAVGRVTEQALGDSGISAAIRPDVPKMGPMAEAIAAYFVRDGG